MTVATTKLPPWFKQKLPDMEKVRDMQRFFREGGLHTVCESAHCPNLGECWGKGVATFMILGDRCTRACRFCAVEAGRPLTVDENEPYQVAMAVQRLNLNYVVITSVARDDLADEGAIHFAKTIFQIRRIAPKTKIEVLIPDLSAKTENIQIVIDAKPEVISHNLETVRRLSRKVRPQAGYERSLEVLKIIKRLDVSVISKSSLMVGLGETKEEMREAMQDLLNVGCDILTVGQYPSPSQSRRHLPVENFVSPDEFETYRQEGLRLGFKHV